MNAIERLHIIRIETSFRVTRLVDLFGGRYKRIHSEAVEADKIYVL